MRSLIFSFCLVLAPSAQAEEANAVTLGQAQIKSGGSVVVKADSSVAKMKIGSAYVTLSKSCQCSLESFDALMPAHKHGMAVKPSKPQLTSSHKDGSTYKVEGIKLQMPGLWHLLLQVKKEDKMTTVTVPYKVDL